MGVGIAVADFAGVFLGNTIAAPDIFFNRAVAGTVIAVFRVEVVAGFAEPGLGDAVAAGGFDLGVVVVKVVEEAEFYVVEVDGLFGPTRIEDFAVEAGRDILVVAVSELAQLRRSNDGMGEDFEFATGLARELTGRLCNPWFAIQLNCDGLR